MTSSTTLAGSRRSTGMPPSVRITGPFQPVNRSCLPSQRSLIRSRQAIPSMSTKSQLEVCGAPMKSVGRSGTRSTTSLQGDTAQNRRAMS